MQTSPTDGPQAFDVSVLVLTTSRTECSETATDRRPHSTVSFGLWRATSTSTLSRRPSSHCWRTRQTARRNVSCTPLSSHEQRDPVRESWLSRSTWHASLSLSETGKRWLYPSHSRLRSCSFLYIQEQSICLAWYLQHIHYVLIHTVTVTQKRFIQYFIQCAHTE